MNITGQTSKHYHLDLVQLQLLLYPLLSTISVLTYGYIGCITTIGVGEALHNALPGSGMVVLEPALRHPAHIVC